MPFSGPHLERPASLRNLLDAGLAHNPEADALIAREQRMSWRDLDASSTWLASSFIGLGLRAGDRVASLMPNRIELVVHYIACIKAGLVATL